MNKKLHNQIKVYTGVVGAILSSEKLNAQVVYHDIAPDDTMNIGFPNSFIQYDLNSDGIIDINAWATGIDFGSHSSSPNLGVIYLYGNYIHKNPSLFGCYNRTMAFLHNPHDSIPGNVPSNSFVHDVDLENILTSINSSNNCFQAADSLNTDKCVAIKFNILGQWHYAWMRVELLHYKVIIKDYAYQSQPYVPILACDLTDLSTGIKENNSHFNFSQQNNSIHISTFQNLNHSNILVYDLLGKEILKQPFEEKETIVTIDKKGIYFVEVNSDKGILRKKVFIY